MTDKNINVRVLSILFKRNTKEGDKIDQSVVNDNQVLFSEISHHSATILKTLNANSYFSWRTEMAGAKPSVLKFEDQK